MTGIVIPPEKGRQGRSSNPLASLGPALSYHTQQIVRRVEALRNQPSPASLLVASVPYLGQKPLEERLFDALADVKILTSRVAMHLDSEWRKKLFHQLDSLHDPSEWEIDDQPIQRESFTTFLKAILVIDPERRPGLGLSNAGYLIAAWTTGRDRLTIEFLPADRVRWVLSRHHNEETERFAGETAVSRLVDGLASHRPAHWFSHAQNHESS